MLKRFLLYGMPLYILGAELALRSILAGLPGRPEDTSLILSGPTIAVAGLSLILPTLTPKPVPLPPGVPANLIAINKNDQLLINSALIAVFVLFFAWLYSIYLTHSMPPHPGAFLIGIVTYMIGIGFTEFKERV